MEEISHRPSIVLHGFQGGIVYSARVALQLADVLLEAWPQPTLAVHLPLQAQDNGNVWRVAGAGPDAQSVFSIEICKRDAAILWLSGRRPPELLPIATTAQRIAAVLAESAGDPDEARRQLPFVATDRGDVWLLRGNRNVDQAVEVPGPFHLEVRKRDCAVLDMYFEGVIHAPETSGALPKT